MDTPLLALTRRRGGPPGRPLTDTAAAENMRQLLQLRWIAVCGQLLAILVVHFALRIPLPLAPMLSVIALLVLANAIGTVLLPRHRANNLEIMLALMFDMGALTAQLYLSGGAGNPFISLYLVQVVLGAILLEVWSAWILVVVAGLCYGGLSVGSLPLAYPPGLVRELGALDTLGRWISFVLSGALLGLFITRITRNLRARDRHLADLREQAAEEDGIVRMGLFASGAAHELGTPLASLSVILSDWRRMPHLTRDAELADELDEMQSEVERCKAIVTDILHSAGEPRVEAMENKAAGAFLADIVAAWRPTHAGVGLDYSCEGLESAAVVAGPALRQAIWNLLDNAAEASPGGIGLIATAAAEELIVTVADRGCGFPPAQLATIGKPYQSSKGAGHGLGLFLATNVARRLGGRLEAGNREGGGAEVKLILPLAPFRPGAA